jgi:hypothetical protein
MDDFTNERMDHDGDDEARDPDSDVSLEIGGACVANVSGTDGFPCIDWDDEEEVERHRAEVVTVARRIAACWNACRGVSTADLEAVAAAKATGVEPEETPNG